MMILTLILLVALYSHSSDAIRGDIPSDPCKYKCFNCTRLDGKPFDILRTNTSEAWERYKVSIKFIKINFSSVQ